MNVLRYVTYSFNGAAKSFNLVTGPNRKNLTDRFAWSLSVRMAGPSYTRFHLVALSRAISMAFNITLLLYVAPDTESTCKDCDFTTVSGITSAGAP